MEIFSYSEQLRKWVEVRAAMRPACVGAFQTGLLALEEAPMRPDICLSAKVLRQHTRGPFLFQHAALLCACMLRMLFSPAQRAGGQQRHVQARDAPADGSPRGCQRHCVGSGAREVGTTVCTLTTTALLCLLRGESMQSRCPRYDLLCLALNAPMIYAAGKAFSRRAFLLRADRQ